MNIKVTTALDVRDGYGYLGQELSLALASLGHKVWVNPVKSWYSNEYIKPELRPLLNHRINNVDFEVIIFYPGVAVTGHKHAIMTMYEANRLPTKWVTMLNGYSHTFAPSKFVHDMFKASGINSVHHTPLGIDIGTYFYVPRNIPNKPFRFLSIGKMEPRKNADVLVKAFLQNYKNNTDVELWIKTREKFLPKELRELTEPNIKIIEQTLPEEGLRQLLYDCDCFVYPSRGEGFSFPPRHALATGMPTIVTDFSALAEIKGAVKIPVDSLSPMYPCGFSYGEESNLLMADIAVEDLAEVMDNVYNNYDEYAKIAAGSKQLSWREAAGMMVNKIEELI